MRVAGYDKCRTLTGADFESVFYLDLWASNLKMVSFYMSESRPLGTSPQLTRLSAVHGGTNWGMLAFPGVYTSCEFRLHLHDLPLTIGLR